MKQDNYTGQFNLYRPFQEHDAWQKYQAEFQILTERAFAIVQCIIEHYEFIQEINLEAGVRELTEREQQMKGQAEEQLAQLQRLIQEEGIEQRIQELLDHLSK